MNYKRTLSGLLTGLFLLLSLSACSNVPDMPTENTYVEGTDYQYMYNDQPMAESPEGYYYWAGYYLYFIDKETMQAVPLCNKPNCLHQKETDPTKVLDCNAFFHPGSGNGVLTYQNGYLYFIGVDPRDPVDSFGQNYLTRMKPDGTERTTVMELENGSSCYLIHRGYLYYATGHYNSRLEGDYGVYRRLLSGKGEAEQIHSVQGKKGRIQRLLAYGNYLYIDEFFSEDNHFTYFEKLVHDLNTGEEHPVIAHEWGDDPMSPHFLNDRMFISIYYNQNLEGTDIPRYYDHFSADLDDGNPQSVPFLEEDYTKAYRTDLDSLYWYTIPWEQESTDGVILQRLDTSGNVLAEYPGLTYSRLATIIPGSKEHLFLSDWDDTDGDGIRDEFVLYWMDKNPEDGILKKEETLRVGMKEYYKEIVINN